jgi:hypothetical protein
MNRIATGPKRIVVHLGDPAGKRGEIHDCPVHALHSRPHLSGVMTCVFNNQLDGGPNGFHYVAVFEFPSDNNFYAR